MNLRRISFLLAAGAGLGLSSAWAADNDWPVRTTGSGLDSNSGITTTAGMPMRTWQAANLIGTDVRNQAGQRLGQVEDAIVDLAHGRIGALLVDTGGPWGVGEPHAVPPSQFISGPGENALTLNMDPTAFRGTPVWNNDWTDIGAQLGDIYRRFGQEANWQAQTRVPPRDRIISAPPYAPSQASQPSATSTMQAPWEKASDLIGTAVRNTTREDLGEIRDLVLDLNSGRVLYTLVDAGLGGTLAAVPPQQFRASDLADTIVLDATRAKLEQAPRFAENALAQLSDPGVARQVYNYYGQTVDWPSNVRTGSMATRTTRTNWKRASNLIGREVRSSDGAELGTINDVVFDVNSGRMVYALLASGGVLGVGQSYYAVPPRQLTVSRTGNTVTLRVPRQQFEQAPHFTQAELSQIENPTRIADVYRYYGDPVYWTTSRAFTREPVTTPEPTWTPAPPEQTPTYPTPIYREPSTPATGLTLTERVRNELRSDSTLADMPERITIRESNGDIILAGPVESQAVKDRIQKAVERVPGIRRIINQIDVSRQR